MYENAWRLENCEEGYPSVYCPNDYICAECPGAWTCIECEDVAYLVMESYDNNGDGSINAGDNLDQEHLGIMLDYCDENGDESLTVCEIYNCVIEHENQWRLENCPDYGLLYCPPMICQGCDGAWTC
jgi:hypothetical protein